MVGDASEASPDYNVSECLLILRMIIEAVPPCRTLTFSKGVGGGGRLF